MRRNAANRRTGGLQAARFLLSLEEFYRKVSSYNALRYLFGRN